MALPSVGAKRRVVIIDDEVAVAEILARMVKSLGFDATVSTDARSSYTFELKTSDVVFVDVLMPHVSGLEVLEKLARQKSQILHRPDERPFGTPRRSREAGEETRS